MSNTILDINQPIIEKQIVSKFQMNCSSNDVEFVQGITDTNAPILMEVLQERIKQEKKWGQQNHEPLKWNAILGEEFGEVSKAILEKDKKNYREELIQVAAVAIAAIDSLDRLEKNPDVHIDNF
jgi:NTP pyrophosphatase (non-canonical NTP hydrolase)